MEAIENGKEGSRATRRGEQDERWHLADALLDLAKADTQFADIYVQRARELIHPELTEAQYAVLERFEEEAADLASRIGVAMADGDWSLVGDLSGRATDLKRAVSEQGALRATAARVYGFGEVLVDPFSPGICGLAGFSERDLPALRDGAVKRLDSLRAADPATAELYEGRRRALVALQLSAAPTAEGDAGASLESLQARARDALAKGDLAQVRRLSAQLLERGAAGAGAARAGSRAGLTPPVLGASFPRGVCDLAGKLGLVAHRVESMAEDAVARFHPSWRAAPGDSSGNTMRLALTVSGDTEEALRDAAELFMNRAFVTSAGTRYIPWMVEEDVLVEDFAAPVPGAPTPTSPLLAALGLPRRTALARKTIEAALRLRGAAVVKEMGLDAREYRLVCLPADVFTRLGRKLGWGTEEIWTHFDGYMASKERKLMALVGGDVRFGGLHDFVAVGADYDSDRLLARFAVVQRRRFEMW